MLLQPTTSRTVGNGLLAVPVVLVFLVVSVTPVQAQLDNGLQSYWPLDGNASDQFGNLNLTGTTGTSFDTGLVGQAGKGTETSGTNVGFFSGTPAGSDFNITNEVTTAAWYRIDGVVGGGEKAGMHVLGRALTYYNPDNNSSFHHHVKYIDTNTDPQTFQTGQISLPMNLGEWYHIVQRVDTSGDVTLWHENAASDDHSGADDSGTLTDYDRIDAGRLTSSDTLVLAYYENKNANGGVVLADEAAIWNRALSDAEIEQLFDNGKAGIPITGDTPPPPTIFTWDETGLGDWNVPSNWDPGSGPPNHPNHTAVFGSSLAADATVVVDSPVTVNRIEFNNTSNSYGIGGKRSVNLTRTTTPAMLNPSIDVQGAHEFQAVVNIHDAATVNVASGATLTFNNALNLNGNTLTKTGDGTLLVNNALNAGGGNVIGVEGTIGGSGTVGGNLDNSDATVAPGNSPGILSVAGNYTQGGGGTLEIEIMGTNPGEGGHDQLNVTGSASLDGTLDIQTDAGFTPGVGAMPGMVGDSLVIITANSRTGEFSTVNGRHAGGGKFYKVGYNPTNVSLGAFQALGGDTEGDLDVDITDFNTLAGNFGITTADWTDADFDSDMDVDITDFNTLAGNFGPYGGGDGPGQVPEPTAVLLLTFGALIISLSALRRHIRNISK